MGETVSAETGFVVVEGGRLYHEVAGEGHPLLLVHADVADSRMWDEQFPVFARHYRVIRYDKRGYGKTTSQDAAFSPRQDIVALLDHLGIARTAILGLSNGGQLALDFTLEYPQRITALIAASTGASGDQPSATAAEMRLFGEFMALEEQKDVPGLIELGVRVWADGPGQPAGRAEASVRERLRAMMDVHYRLHPEQLRPRDLEPPAVGRLGEIRVPTLVIAGDLDFTGVIGAASLLAKRVAGARKVVFPGTAHMVNMEQPERFNAQVLDFLPQA